MCGDLFISTWGELKPRGWMRSVKESVRVYVAEWEDRRAGGIRKAPTPKGRAKRQKVEWWSSGVGWRKVGSQCLMGTEFQFCKIKRALEMDGGDGCTTIWMYLMLLSCRVKNGKFYVMCTWPQLFFYVHLTFLIFNLIFILYWSIVDLKCCVSLGVQQSESVIHIHISILFQILSRIGYYRILSRVPCAIL